MKKTSRKEKGFPNTLMFFMIKGPIIINTTRLVNKKVYQSNPKVFNHVKFL
jgi:hypothetical protein